MQLEMGPDGLLRMTVDGDAFSMMTAADNGSVASGLIGQVATI